MKDGQASLVKLSRLISEKFEYYSHHKIGKARVLGFEFHHVVLLAWEESREQFKLLDTWKNMVYIDAFSHAKITQNNNRNVVMSKKKSTVILSDHLGNKIKLVLNRHIRYLPENLPTMLNYNINLRAMTGQGNSPYPITKDFLPRQAKK